MTDRDGKTGIENRRDEMTKKEMANDIIRALFNQPTATDAVIEGVAAYRRHRNKLMRTKRKLLEDTHHTARIILDRKAAS